MDSVIEVIRDVFCLGDVFWELKNFFVKRIIILFCKFKGLYIRYFFFIVNDIFCEIKNLVG